MNTLLNKAKIIINYFIKSFRKSSTESTIKEVYEDLTPKSDIDNDSRYSNAIKWALENNNINNVALTGPYGSGKSSVIKTFKKKYNKQYKFLNISLASFKDEVPENENTLEKSILLQMLYKVSDNTLPHSRFKRIYHINRFNLFLKICLLLTFIIVGLQLINPDLVSNTYKNTYIKESITSENKVSLLYLTFLLVIFIGCLFYFLNTIINFFGRNLKLSILTLPNATLEMASDSNNSIFDKYLDEILYFFEVTKYDVVVFEDLDRFNSIEIFEKLRELNLLINNAEQITQRVVFLYAIKDDMFGKEDDMFFSRNRTKFFDFIVPVIPVINSSNSGQILLEKIKASNVDDAITEEFINDITVYVDDMRILINICNEFSIYKAKLGNIDLIPNKLLAIILYKNIYPKDFAELHLNSGMVYEVIQNKASLIRSLVEKIENECEQIEKEISQVQSESISNIEELKIIYADALGLTNNNQVNIYLDNAQFNYSNWRGNFFERLENANTISYSNNRGKHTNSKLHLETVFGTKKSFFERKRNIDINERNALETLKERLEKLKKEKEEVLSWSLVDVINKSDINDVFGQKIINEKLLVFLLRNGYIDEMYNQYITYFYPGSLTTEDMKFILSVKDQEALAYNYELHNVKEVLKRLHGREFKRSEILNYTLVEFLIDNKDKYRLFHDLVIEQLINHENISFIDSFMTISKNKQEFIKVLGDQWPGFWSFITSYSNFTNTKINDYLAEIVKYVDVDAIILMNIDNKLSDYISKKSDFLSLISEVHYSKIKKILKELQVRFVNLEMPLGESELFQFVYENNLYSINEKMIEKIFLGQVGENKIPSYNNILKSGLQHLSINVDTNIEEYIKNVFLNLENSNEDEESIINLLTNEDIGLDVKKDIIRHAKVKIGEISSIAVSLWEDLIANNRVISSWNNLLTYYGEVGGLNDLIVGFLNTNENSYELSQTQISENNEIDEKLLEEFSIEIIRCKEINDASYIRLIRSMSRYDSLNIGDMTFKRVEILVENDILRMTPDNIRSLKQNFPPLHLLLIYKNIDLFIIDQDIYDLSPDDYKEILESSLNDEIKDRFLQNIRTDISLNSPDLYPLLTKRIISRGLKVKEELVDVLLGFELPLINKIYLIVTQIKEYNNESITDKIKKLGTPYMDITENGKRPLIKDDEVNRLLLTELEAQNYISSWKIEDGKLRINTKLK